MAIDFGSYGFDYTRELCLAIERYTASAVARDSSAYIYRGMQLRYAVERWLYIIGINSEVLFSHYLARIGVSHSVALPVMDTVESDIAFFLSTHRLANDHPQRRMGRWFIKTARRAYGWLRRWRPRVDLEKMPVKVGGTLIHVNNIKFASYLESVTNELNPDSFAYLVTSDLGLYEQLSQRGLPVVEFPDEGTLSHHVFCSYALSDFPKIVHDAYTVISALRSLQPTSVLVVEGNAPKDVITAEASRLLRIPCYCIQQGWSPYVHSGFRNMNYTEMFVWGDRFAELLRPYNLSQVFRVTGSHVLKTDVSPSVRSEVNTLSFFLQAPCALLGGQTYADFVDLIVCVAQAHPGVRVIVREHPGFPVPNELRHKLQNCMNVHFSNPTIELLSDVIDVSDLVISIFSTVLLEAMAKNVVPLICSIGAMRQYEPPIAELGAAIEVQSIEDARRVIDEVIADPKRLTAIRNSMAAISGEFFYPNGSAKKIAALVENVREHSYV